MPQISDTYVEAIPGPEPVESAPSRFHILGRGLKWILLLVVLGWIASEGISLAIQHTRLHGVLTARMEASFGRPVEVGNYHFSVWGGPALEAQSVTVAEDPRFGPEYFLRAESMTVGLRWQSLLRGRIDLGTLSLVRPSLNLVRNADGAWNLDEWLPRPGGARPANMVVGPSLPSSPFSFRKIEVEGGRINFKRGDEKVPFALVGVTGTVETDRPGRWRMDLQAAPWRAAVVLQQMGMIHLAGDVGGTSSRLRPAALDISWTDASLPDVLRLAFGNDNGIRGEMALSVNARTQEQGDGWAIQGRTELRQIHRWDLALRPDNPSVNLITRMEWHPAASSLELNEIAFEAPHSNARGAGRILWDSAATPAAKKSTPVEFALSDSQLDVGDMLAWVRAFHPGVADGVAAHGIAGFRADISGWPLHLANATLSSDGVDLSGLAFRKAVHLGEVQVSYDHGVIAFRPIALSWGPLAGPPGGSLRMDVSTAPVHKPISTWHIAGAANDVRDLISGASALGWNISRGWDMAGQVACDLRWEAEPGQWPLRAIQRPVGWIEFGGSGAGLGDAALHAPFLNRPVEHIKARAEWNAGVRHIALTSAQAFGASWNGSFDRRDPAGDWQFALSADRLVAADLDRWLNPLWRESFLNRMLPFLNPGSQENAVPESLRASGHLALGEFTLEPYDVRRLDADLTIGGRHIALANASGQFYGGTIAGSLDADLRSAPSYSTNFEFSRVDLAALSAESPTLAHLFAGLASGTASFQTRGATRSDLLAYLECKGDAQVANPELQSIDLGSSLREGKYRAGSDQFTAASAVFSCAQGAITFQTLGFVRPDAGIEGSGTVDFSRNLDLRFQMTPAPPGRSVQVYKLTGPLAALQVTSATKPPTRPR